jgi:hypothetical protein
MMYCRMMRLQIEAVSRTETDLRVCFFIGAPGMARCAKRNQLGCGGHAGDLEVKVLYTPGKGKC